MKAPIGERVRKVRREQDLTQEELARLAGINVITISRLEKRTAKEVYADTVVALADALDVSADYLLGRCEKQGGMNAVGRET
jgi:transcriptional regulator with XRE-family HTH domain